MSTPHGQPQAAAVSGGGGKRRLLLAAGALLLAGGGVVAFQRRETSHEPVAKKPAPLRPGMVELEPFVLNLADPAGDRYFRLAVRLALDRMEVAERAAHGLGEVKLRDLILSLLSKKHAGEMTSAEGRECLRKEIAEASEALLARPPFHDGADDPPAHVVDVYFTEFLVQ